MSRTLDFRSREAIGLASEELKEMVDQAGTGSCSWYDVADYLHTLFPGYMAFALNQSLRRPHLNFHAFPGLDDRQVDDYFRYYGPLNPWLPAWDKREVGVISRSEHDDPIRLKAHTEFYNDWMNRGVEADAAVGIKIGASKDEICYLGVHYAAGRDELFGPALERILSGVQDHFIRAVEINHHLVLAGEKSASAAALVDRSQDIGVVIDGQMRVLEANAMAQHHLDRMGVIDDRMGVFHVNDRGAQDWLRQALDMAAMSRSAQTRRRLFDVGNAQWRLSVTPLSAMPGAGTIGLFVPRKLFLVLLRNIAGAALPSDGDAFRQHYHLTAREWALCREILEGHDLADCAERLGVAIETARHQLKSIFRKTGTNRQSGLMALMTRAI